MRDNKMRRDLSRYKNLVSLHCPGCGSEFKRPPNEALTAKFCSRRCRDNAKALMVGEKNPSWKPRPACRSCGKTIEKYRKGKLFCSRACFHISDNCVDRNVGPNGERYPGAIDGNQNEIVKALEGAGVSVLVTSAIRGGVPDILASNGERTALLEVKNPLNYYGRRGFNSQQRAFADMWQGELYIVFDPQDALAVFGIGVGNRPKDMSGFARGIHCAPSL